jgi:hypothetical protein
MKKVILYSKKKNKIQNVGTNLQVPTICHNKEKLNYEDISDWTS